MKDIFKLLFILVLFSGCSSDGIDCVTGPVGFTFEVVNETTGENLFEDELFAEDQLQTVNENGESVEYNFEKERM